MSTVRLVLAQINPLVGDIRGNAARLVATYREQLAQAPFDLMVFPELVLTGYPPEDLLLRPSLQPRIEKALAQLCDATAGQAAAIIAGYPAVREGRLYNCAGFFAQGKLQAEYHKQYLPNYQVFDEKRYFDPGTSHCLVRVNDVPVALTVCEDIWHPEPMQQARAAGARLMVNINASPFHTDKPREREQLLTGRAREGQMPVVYVNQVGGQDELVFDGNSMVVDESGRLLCRLPLFAEKICAIALPVPAAAAVVDAQQVAPLPPVVKSVYQALVTGVRDYVNKNHFKGVVLGLSGGVDSALTLAVAVDALGADRVEAVMMPFRYTAAMSVEDAAEQARRLGVTCRSISIEPMYEAFVQGLQQEFAGTSRDTTEENIQARCRGVLLMAISNKKGYMVVTTGNKSEMAVGYCTLYGDMVGGYAVLKDVFKTLVYQLVEYRNSISEVIPRRVIERAPSAELAPGQKDEDSLPPYSALDQILELYIEQDISAQGIIARGFAAEVVHKVVRLVDRNEYKRRQAPVGVRITQRSFGRDRRYPITSGWEPGE